MDKSTALAPVDGATGLDLTGFDTDKFNVLMPVALDTAAACLRFQVVQVRLDPDPQSGDCYPAPGGKALALAKTGLMKIASAVGLVMDTEESGFIRPDVCERCIAQTQAGGQAARSCRDCPSCYDVVYQAVGRIPDATIDSGWRTYMATCGWELEAERAEIEAKAKSKGAAERRLQEVTRHRHRLTETKAWLRVIRAICNLPHSLPPEKMALPFVTVRPEHVISPEVLAERAAQSAAQLYGSTPAQAAPAATVEEVPDSVPPEPDEDGPADDAEPGDGDPFADDVVKCDECGGAVEPEALIYCQSDEGREEFGGAVFCVKCGKKGRASRAKASAKGGKAQ